MRTRLYSILLALGLIGLACMAPTARAETHGEILGIRWQWAQLTETQPAGQSVILNPENYVLVLNDDGSANIKADCNQLQWTYTLEGTDLTFNTLGPSTLAFCGEDSSDQQFLELLGKGGTVSVEDGRLVLTLNDNAGMMVFDNAGAEDEAPETMPETGAAPVAASWAVTILAGLLTVTAGAVLRRNQP